MRTQFFFIAAAALGLSSPLVAKNNDRAVFEPISPWNVDYADDYCTLRRVFQRGEDRADLELRQYSPGEEFDLILVVQGFEVEKKEEPRIRFNPHGADAVLSHVFGMTGAGGYEGFFTSLSFGPKAVEQTEGSASPAEEQIEDWARQVASISFEEGFGQPLSLETGNLDQPRKAMQTCTASLLESWGINSASDKTKLRGATLKEQMGGARRLHEGYPTEALRKGYQGPVQVRILVGADGNPTDCKSLSTFTKAVLQDATCRSLMRNARFDPALDADGKPMASYYVTRITYMLR